MKLDKYNDLAEEYLSDSGACVALAHEAGAALKECVDRIKELEGIIDNLVDAGLDND